MRILSLLAIILGIPLAAAPWWWPEFVGGQRAWSNAQAAEYSKASANYHHAAHESGDTSGGVSQAAVEAQARYQRNREALDQARSAGQTAATVMRYLGIAILFAGLMGWAASMPLGRFDAAVGHKRAE